MEAEWNVICPGPSLSRWGSIKDLRTVAVNSAIVTARKKGWRVDYLCCNDGIRPLRAYVDMEKPEECPIVWTQACNRKRVEESGFRVEAYPGKREFKKNICGFTCINRTVYFALALVIHRGAREINLYGCDMTGIGYADGDDLSRRCKTQWMKRWHKEERMMERAFAYWAEREIQINRLTP